MLDACPHHHEEEAEKALDGVSLRTPGKSTGVAASKRFWRSIDEISGTEAFEKLMHREFPFAASEWLDGPSRRNFLKLMGASLALGGLSACTMRKTTEQIVPYVDPPEDVIPGRPLFFASTMPWCGYAKGVLVESHEGRPTKIEGNPDHPASLGASDIWMQASVLDLYDPDRSQVVKHGNSVSTWGAFISDIQPQLSAQHAQQGAGLRFLTGAITSPTIHRQMLYILQQYPKAKWHQYEAIGRRNARDGAIAAFGEDVQCIYQFDKADVIVSLDSNFLTDDPASLIYARRFIDGRRIRKDGPAKMNRLYVAESTVTLTGAMADHRLAIKSGDIQSLALDLATAVAGGTPTSTNSKWVAAVAKDLLAAKAKALVVVGENQPPAVHAVAHAINNALLSSGNTVVYIDPVEVAGPDGSHTLEELVEDMRGGNVDLLFIMGTNPVYNAPPPLELSAGLRETTAQDRSDDYRGKNPFARVKTIVHHGIYGPNEDETAFFNTWHIPASHYLEAWGDARSFDGSASIIQPLIYPLYTTKSDLELLALIAGQTDPNQLDRTGYDLVRDTWAKQLPQPVEASWQKSLEKGVIPNTAFKPKTVVLKPNPGITGGSAQPTAGFEIVFRPDPNVWDGRYANNAWLQELPKPVSSLTWDNVAFMSLATAQKLGVTQTNPGRSVKASIVEVKVQGRTLNLPALVMPGHADESLTVYLGYGRARTGRVAGDVGANACSLRGASNEWIATAVEVNLTDDTYKIATTQQHHLLENKSKKDYDSQWLEGRELIKTYSLDEVKTQWQTEKEKSPRTIALPLADPVGDIEPGEKLIPDWRYDYNKWAMVIDNNSCIGCNACVVACQSENNIPVVGKEQVLNDREMHWIRIDTYFEGEPSGTPDTYFQPIPCMQCEDAPCELVCPVEATTHSAEGINEQTYNRCVGTRYCSNNCPYKVRRFNFLYYNDYSTQSLMLQKNPNVTVRGRGIMEKCNYCVQRINNARIEAKKLDREIKPGEVVTACAQACPTQAIVFGNINPNSKENWDVLKLQDEPLRYSLLGELNTKPRTTYLGRVKNHNPELA